MMRLQVRRAVDTIRVKLDTLKSWSKGTLLCCFVPGCGYGDPYLRRTAKSM